MNEQQITINRSRGLARQLFLSAFPTSAEWFDLAWETASAKEWDYAASPTALADALHVSDATNPVVKEMAREFAILFETFMQRFPVAREALLERLEQSCKKYGKSDRATERSKNKLMQNLLLGEEASVRNKSSLFLERFINGRHFPVLEVSESEAQAFLDETPFDIIVNEPKDTIKVRKKAAEKIYQVAPRLRGMLWLILTKATSQRKVLYQEIGELFGLPRDPASRDGKIHQYRDRLETELLTGNLCNVIFEKGANKVYPLRKNGWSFYWLRFTQDTAKSNLLYEFPGINPVEKA